MPFFCFVKLTFWVLSLKADNNSDVGEDVFEESEVVNEERIGK